MGAMEKKILQQMKDSIENKDNINNIYNEIKKDIVINNKRESLISNRRQTTKSSNVKQFLLKRAVTKNYNINSIKDNIVVPSLNLKDFDGEVVTDFYGREIPKPAHGSASLGSETNSSKTIVETFVELFERITNPSWLVRRVNITANNTKLESLRQPGLFDHVDEKEGGLNQDKENSLQKARLEIMRKYGKNAILKGMDLEEGATTIDRNSQIGGHKA